MTDPTLLRLVHSVLWPGFSGREAPDWLVEALGNGLAGVVYFAGNIDADDPAQLPALSDRIHQLNPDALIGVDEEGGIVSRLQASVGSSTPGNAVLGRLDDLATTEQVGRWTGELVRANGIDVDLAPSVDVNNNPKNPVIGVRSFGADPALVARHGAAWIRGLQSTGVAACAKHFPGHGDTATDSHLAPATANVDLEELAAVHLPPFEAAIQAGVPMVMTAHITVPALGELPATINPASLQLLRSLGFDGVICTDALDMAAISGTIGIGGGAVAALAGGADLLCIGNPNTNPPNGSDRRDVADFRAAMTAVHNALVGGELAVERVEQAAERVARLARWCRGQHLADGTGRALPAEFDGAAPAARALQTRGEVALRGDRILVVDGRMRRNVAVDDAPDVFTTALRQRRQVDRIGLSGLSATDAADAVRQAIAERTADSSVVLLTGTPQSNDTESAIVRQTIELCPEAVVVYTGWPPADGLAANAVLSYGASRAGAVATVGALLPT